MKYFEEFLRNSGIAGDDDIENAKNEEEMIADEIRTEE